MWLDCGVTLVLAVIVADLPWAAIFSSSSHTTLAAMTTFNLVTIASAIYLNRQYELEEQAATGR